MDRVSVLQVPRVEGSSNSIVVWMWLIPLNCTLKNSQDHKSCVTHLPKLLGNFSGIKK